MKPSLKLFLFGILSLLLMVGGCFGLMFQDIRNPKGCKAFVIDSYEVHSGINIPRVEGIDCVHDAELGMRMATYKTLESMTSPKFRALHEGESQLLESQFPLLTSDPLPAHRPLKVATGRKWQRDWAYVWDEKGEKLWAMMRYWN